MHELSFAENIFQLVINKIKAEPIIKTLKIYISASVLSGIVQESFQFYWDILTKDTRLESSKLYIRIKPVHITCNSCHNQFIIKHYADPLVPCPKCGNINTVITGDTSVILNKITFNSKS